MLDCTLKLQEGDLDLVNKQPSRQPPSHLHFVDHSNCISTQHFSSKVDCSNETVDSKTSMVRSANLISSLHTHQPQADFEFVDACLIVNVIVYIAASRLMQCQCHGQGCYKQCAVAALKNAFLCILHARNGLFSLWNPQLLYAW